MIQNDEKKGNGMTLQTNRLLLSPVSPEDAKALLPIQNSEFVLKYNGMEPWDLEKMRAWIGKEKEHNLVIKSRENGQVIGLIGIVEDSLRYDVGSKELNFYLAEEFSRRGYMTEALNAVIRRLFEEAGLSVVTARAFTPNAASRRLLEKLGFHLDGVLRRCVKGYGGAVFDDAVYSLLKEEFLEKN